MSEKPTKKQNAITWGRITAEIIGWPVLVYGIFSYSQKMVFTVTCETAGWRCQYAFNSPSAGTAVSADGSGMADIKNQLSNLSAVVSTMGGSMGFIVDPSAGTVGKDKGKQ